MKKPSLQKSVLTVSSVLDTVPAEYSAECSILLRVEVFRCNNYWKMSDLEEQKWGQKQKPMQILET